MGCNGSASVDDNGVDKELAAAADRESKKVKLLLLGGGNIYNMSTQMFETF
jgi:hypothetical protein